MAQGAEIAPGSSLYPSTLLKPALAGIWIPRCQPILYQVSYGLVVISGFSLTAKEAADPKAPKWTLRPGQAPDQGQ